MTVSGQNRKLIGDREDRFYCEWTLAVSCHLPFGFFPLETHLQLVLSLVNSSLLLLPLLLLLRADTVWGAPVAEEEL